MSFKVQASLEGWRDIATDITDLEVAKEAARSAYFKQDAAVFRVVNEDGDVVFEIGTVPTTEEVTKP